MGLEIRPATANEMDEFVHVADTAVVSSAAGVSGIPPELTLCAFEAGKILRKIVFNAGLVRR